MIPLIKLILVWYTLLSIGVSTAMTIYYTRFSGWKSWRGVALFYLNMLWMWLPFLVVSAWEHVKWLIRTPKESRW